MGAGVEGVEKFVLRVGIDKEFRLFALLYSNLHRSLGSTEFETDVFRKFLNQFF